VASSPPTVQRSTPRRARNFRSALPRKETFFLGLLLIVATFAVYYPVRSYPYLDYDDAKYVTENPHIQAGLSTDTVSWAFTHGYAANYHPLTWVSHAIDIDVFALDPSGPHLENVIFHIFDALLVFWVLLRATGYVGRSWMVAALFALHPINVESVAWVAERKTVLSTMFFLLALGAYRWYVSKPGARRYLVVALLFILGLWAKPQVITFPFVLLLWDYWPLRRVSTSWDRRSSDGDGVQPYPERSWGWLIKEKIPLFIICLVDAGVTMVAQGAAGSPQGFSLSNRLQNAVVAYARYIGKALWPANLAIMYPHPRNTLHWWQVLAALLLLGAITALAVRAARRHRYLLVGWLWFLGTLVPMIGLVQVDVQAMADRYAYISFVGLFLMFVWGIADWAQERHVPVIALPVVSTVVLLALTAVTHRQISYWSSDLALWQRSLQVSPEHNFKGEYFMGAALQKQGQNEEAVQHFFRAESMFRGDPFINLSIADYEQEKGNLPEAVKYYQLALATSGNQQLRARVLAQMAHDYAQMGDLERARQYSAGSSETAHASQVTWQGKWWEQMGPAIQAWWAQHFGSGKK
jgi:tetratricopeptide (TPR) repeat protein